MTRALSRFAWAMLLRCPNCGGGPIFRSWFSIAKTCPQCGLRFERGEDGYFVGAWAINLVVGEGIPVVGIVVAWIATLPSPPYLQMEVGAIAAGILLPLLFFPFSRTLWLALDISFRPIEARELEPVVGSGGHLPKNQ